MKRMLCLILCAALVLSCLPAFAAQTETQEAHTLEKGSYPLYTMAGKSPFPLKLYFADGVDDLPFIHLPDFVAFINLLSGDLSGSLYTGEYIEDAETYQITYNPTESDVLIRFRDQTILISNFESFGGDPDQTLMDSLGSTGFNEETGEPELYYRLANQAMDRAGSVQIISLEDYTIPLIRQDGLMLIPMQTAFDLMIGMRHGSCFYFNGQAAFVGTWSMFAQQLRDPETGAAVWVPTETGEVYYSAEKKERSEESRFYGIGEFCMIMDHFYGLKEAHNIKSFADLLVNTNYYMRLMDPDPEEADTALMEFINYYLDDLHSAFKLNSWGTGLETELETTGIGFSRLTDIRNQQMYDEVKYALHPEGLPAYEEVGDTAYVTFDSFLKDDEIDYYDLDLDDPDCIQDTVSLILFANHRIQRENSPIKNVVLDLSNNSGGMVDAAVFVIGWYLGVAPITTVSTFTGAQSTAMYRVDTDLDRDFTSEDSLAGKYRLFCLTSPLSFSCGNLLPWVFKASGLVTLIGDTTGGGSCMVRQMSTPWGTSFQTSSHSRLAFIKNGSFYDVDRGVEPDVVLTRLESFYDREKLTDIINRLD